MNLLLNAIFEKHIIMREAFNEKELWQAVRGAWKDLNFSCIHHGITKDESALEYYQTLYGTVITLVDHRSLDDI